MKNISKFEKEKLLHLLECKENEFDTLTESFLKILEQDNNLYDTLLKILLQINSSNSSLVTLNSNKV